MIMRPDPGNRPAQLLTMYILCDNLSSKTIVWDEEKNVFLKRRRGISFEDVVRALRRIGEKDQG